MWIVTLLFISSKFWSIYGQKEWTNGRFSCMRTDEVSLDNELKLGCWIPWLEASWGKCVVITPGGENWFVSSGVVTDEAGNIIEGVVGFVNANACGVAVEKAIGDQLGDWYFVYSQEEVLHKLVLTTANVVSDIRLPETFLPNHYNVRFVPDYEYTGNNIKFSGYVFMFLSPLVDTNTITFHADEITPEGVPTVSKSENTNWLDVSVEEVHFDLPRTFVHLKINESSLSSDTWRVGVNFTADISREYRNNDTYGFYPQICSETNGSPKKCWFTQFQSTYARTAFPCLDEPGLKATFNIEVVRTEDYHVRSNMPLVETQQIPNNPGYFLDSFFTTEIMSPYLVAVAISDYVSLPSIDNSTAIWGPREDIEAGRGDFSNVISAELMKYYAEKFGVEYSFPKQDLMYVANKKNGMENWGLVLIGPPQLMMDSNATDDERFLVVRVVAHELAHQWFGNLVTCDWWGQTWLNEGFAVYVSYLGAEYLEHTDLINFPPFLYPMERFFVHEKQMIMKTDIDRNIHWALTDETTDRADIGRKFGDLTYHKGGSIVMMMQYILKYHTFIEGLSLYLKDFSHQSTIEDDLFVQLEAVAQENGHWPPTNKPFSEVMKSWTNQAGFPLVHASLSSGILSVNQTWLVLDGPTLEKRTWDIPLTLKSIGISPAVGWGIGSEPMKWLWQEQEAADFDVSGLFPDDTPFMMNIHGTGYYRINYDQDHWNKLADVLKSNRDLIHPLDRINLICDVATLAQTGHVTMETRDNVLSYIDMETDFGPKLAFQECVSSGFKS